MRSTVASAVNGVILAVVRFGAENAARIYAAAFASVAQSLNAISPGAAERVAAQLTKAGDTQ